jgi:hypothetical protein
MPHYEFAVSYEPFSSPLELPIFFDTSLNFPEKYIRPKWAACLRAFPQNRCPSLYGDPDKITKAAMICLTFYMFCAGSTRP